MIPLSLRLYSTCKYTQFPEFRNNAITCSCVRSFSWNNSKIDLFIVFSFCLIVYQSHIRKRKNDMKFKKFLKFTAIPFTSLSCSPTRNWSLTCATLPGRRNVIDGGCNWSVPPIITSNFTFFILKKYFTILKLSKFEKKKDCKNLSFYY